MMIEELNRNVFFEELEIGDVFRFSGRYFLKTPPYKAEETGCIYTAYDLTNDGYCFFDTERQVTPVKAKLVIE